MIATTMILLLVLLGISIPVGAALGVLGLILDPLYSMLPLTRALGELSWSTSNEFLLVAIPLFILLGEILLRAGFAEGRLHSSWETPVACLPSEMPVMMTKSGSRSRMLSRLSAVDLPTAETAEESTP